MAPRSEAGGPAREKATFALPLRPGADPDVGDAAAMAKSFESEYMARYLEKIHVNPSKATAALVSKNAPFAAAKLKTSLRANGGLSDELLVETPPLQQQVRIGFHRASPKDVYNTGLLLDVGESPQIVTPTGFADVFANVHGTKDEDEQEFGEEVDENLLKKYAKRFCFPWNLLEKEKAQRARALDTKGRASNQEDASARREAVQNELRRGFRRPQESYMADSLKAFDSSLHAWAAGLRPTALRDRVTRADLDETSVLLRHKHTAALFDAMADFLYASVVAPAADANLAGSAREDPEAQRSRMLMVQQGAASLEKKCRSSRGLLFFAFPVLIVALRASVEMLFKAAFPLFVDSEAGKDATDQMQACITSVFDPNGYFGAVPVLMSDSESVGGMRRLGRRAHAPPRMHFGDTSAALRAAIGSPMNARARVMMSNGPDGPRQHSGVRPKDGPTH